MGAAMDNVLVRRIGSVIALDGAERDVLARLTAAAEAVPPRTGLSDDGDDGTGPVLVLLEGWAIRCRSLPDGRRQVTDLVLPGDPVGLYGGLAGRPGEGLETLGPARVARLDPWLLPALLHDRPRLALALLHLEAVGTGILAERLFSLGRRTALERLGHLLLELDHRLERVGLAEGGRFSLPATQEVLADLLGLSIVHVNRTLRQLREAGLLETAGSGIVLPDRPALARRAQFDDAYLHPHGLSPAAEERALERLRAR
ncbi:Crp/Fnr family transcriptional regulator [Rhodocista pekingensis]|uniref:Crp/Fnr family transcriptional regulator n=1 Tax=Rhodocista pekingensis TaxID=201185 RepID=A0ABW2KWC8_9PROT